MNEWMNGQMTHTIEYNSNRPDIKYRNNKKNGLLKKTQNSRISA